MDNQPSGGYNWTVPVSTGYVEDYLNDQTPSTDPVLLNLTAGIHTVTVYLWEDGTRLDKLELELQGSHTANVTSYVYDTDGQRMKTVEPSGKTVYYPFPGFQVEVDGSETTQRLTYALGGQTVALRQTGLIGKDDFNDGNANGWTAHSGSWSVVSNAYQQTNAAHTATNSSYPLPQSGSMTYEWQTTFNSGLVVSALHFFGSEASSTNHGNSYLAWQTASHVRIYESVNNTLYLRASASLSASNEQIYSYKVTYNPATGQIVLYRDSSQVLTWTDTSPISSGSYIALRTSQSNVTFDNVRVTAQSGVLTYMHNDHLGSNRLLTNSTGGAVVGSTIRYYPFGHWRTAPTADLTDRGFTGHMHDMNVGLIYMNARWYSAGIARFLSPDTIVPDPTNPQSFNRYSYGYNNPVKYQDPTGHKPTDGCEYEGCSLPDFMNPNETWQDADETYYPYDPALAALYPGDLTWEEVAFTVTGMVGISAFPAAAEYALGQVVWPALVEAGGTIASWLCLNDGDCGNEAQTASNVGRQSINWLANQANRVNHIINPSAGGKYRPGHDWSQLINYSGNQSQDYQALQPYLDTVVQYGASTTTATGQTVFAATVNSVPIEVIGNMQNGIFVITDAWIVLP